MKTIARWALVPLAAAVLAGCNRDPDNAEATAAAAAPSSETLAAALRARHADLGRLVDNAGLGNALDGVGPYTVFAPPGSSLSAGGADLADPARKAEGAALVQAHIAPGTLTRADIEAAVDRGQGAGVQMRTMDGALLTFSRDGEALVATTPDGVRVRLTGEDALVSNGAILGVDGILVRPAAAAG